MFSDAFVIFVTAAVMMSTVARLIRAGAFSPRTVVRLICDAPSSSRDGAVMFSDGPVMKSDATLMMVKPPSMRMTTAVRALTVDRPIITAAVQTLRLKFPFMLATFPLRAVDASTRRAEILERNACFWTALSRLPEKPSADPDPFGYAIFRPRQNPSHFRDVDADTCTPQLSDRGQLRPFWETGSPLVRTVDHWPVGAATRSRSMIFPRFGGRSDYAANAASCDLNSNSIGLT